MSPNAGAEDGCKAVILASLRSSGRSLLSRVGGETGGYRSMKIGMITDSLAAMSFDEMLAASAELGLETLEFACGNWSTAPHIHLGAMLGSEKTRREFSAKVEAHGMSVSALNCSGNPLHPGKKGESIIR